MIRVLVVDDSPVAQELFVHILSSDPEIQPAGVANDGVDALAAVERLRPNVILMDIHMPRMNGLEATKKIMETHPTPIIMVSGSYSPEDTYKSFQAMNAGALYLLKKPEGIGHPRYQDEASELTKIVRLMSEVKMVKRWPRPGKDDSPTTIAHKPGQNLPRPEIKGVVVGASTGGPAVFHTILTALPKAFPVPILAVQHMSLGFIDSFVTWITMTTGFPARIARHGEMLSPGQAYFAPDNHHILVGTGDRIILVEGNSQNGLCPSVAQLFNSAAEVWNRNVVGVLLTGMGLDGAEELKFMREKGAVTVAQDEDSCVVFGMPGSAIKLGAAQYVLDPGEIAKLLSDLVRPEESK
jgi:two-component system chemotaxis response regulator CheB